MAHGRLPASPRAAWPEASRVLAGRKRSASAFASFAAFCDDAQDSESAVDTLAPGFDIHNAKTICLLGTGTSSEVVLASILRRRRNSASGSRHIEAQVEERFVAVKICEAAAKEGTKRSAAEVELDVLGYLMEHGASEFIVRLEGALRTPLHSFLAVEYCPGGDLHNLQSNVETFSPSAVRFYVAEIALGLSHLHKHHILYGDLKPENIGVGADGHIRLFDFGLSVRLDQEGEWDEDSARFVVVTGSGTLPYSAPEILLRQPHGFESDWWGLGVVAFELAFRMLPWDADEAEELCRMICFDPVDFPQAEADSVEDLEACADFISLCLHKDGKNRVGNSHDAFESEVAQHAFFAALDLEQVANKHIAPPVLPLLAGPLDVSNFDADFVRQRPNFTIERTAAMLAR